MVVPIVAITMSTNAGVGMNVGTNVDLMTSPQSGLAMNAAIT